MRRRRFLLGLLALLGSTLVAGAAVPAGETRGGVAPTGACDPAADRTRAVPYRARYVFYAG